MKPSLLLSLLLVTLTRASPPVRVSLQPAWQAQPLLTELIETIALENPLSFFGLLDAVLDPSASPPVSSLSPEALYNYVLELASSTGALRLPAAKTRVELNLALRAAAPKTEAFYHHYEIITPPNCGSWVYWYGQQVCSVKELASLVEAKETIEAEAGLDHSQSPARPKTLSFDHIRPALSASKRPLRTAILYSNLTSPNTHELHSYLLSHSQGASPSVEYIFRPAPLQNSNVGRKPALTGYGVALDLKKMDYLAVDDRQLHHTSPSSNDNSAQAVLGEESVDHITELLDQYPSLYDTVNASHPLSEQELRVLGLQAIQLIQSSSSPLFTFKTLVQNFPRYAASVSRRVNLDERVIEEEVVTNSERVTQGMNLVWINGAAVPPKDINPLGFLRVLDKERLISLSLQSLGLNASQVIDLITHPGISSAQTTASSGVTSGLFDSSDKQEGGGTIVWWNDIENDERYAKWSPSIHQILRPLYPGQYHNVKINLFNVVLTLDLSNTNSVDFISGSIYTIISRSFPFRFGVVPIVESESGAKMAKLFYYISETQGMKMAMTFCRELSTLHLSRTSEPPTSEVDWSLVKSAYEDILAGTPHDDLETVVAATSREEEVAKAKAYAKRLSVNLSESPKGQVFLNGRPITMDEKILRTLPQEVAKQLQHLQEKLYLGELTEDPATLATYFYDLRSTSAQRNSYIYPDPSNPSSLRIYNMVEEYSKSSFSLSAGAFAAPHESEALPLTFLVVADFDTPAGLALAIEALTSVTPNSKARFSFVHNPTEATAAGKRDASKLIFNLMSSKLISRLAPQSVIEKLQNVDASSGVEAETYAAYVKSCAQLALQLSIAPGAQAVIVNGRVVGPIKNGDFTSDVFTALEEYELTSRTQPVFDVIKEVLPSSEQLDRSSLADLVSMASSIVASIQLPDPSESGLFDTPARPRAKSYDVMQGEQTRFVIGNKQTALYQVVLIVDPLSSTAQKWCSYLEWLLAIPDVYLEVYMHPSFYKEMPLKRFYRYNLQQGLVFDEAGNEVFAETVFEDLPTDPIYTMAMDVPSSWLVRPREAVYDLDNIQLSKLYPEDQDSGVTAVFGLDYLVVEGHAREAHNMAPPRGLQLQLLESDGTSIDDTQVVANLGYFQFKAKPGVFRLDIREGRGRKVYAMQSVGGQGWESPDVAAAGYEISVTNFEGLTLYPRMAKRPGMEMADVLNDSEDEGQAEPGLFETITNKVFSMFGSSTGSTTDLVVKGSSQADINIFTVASGLLYERFVGIMILSVLRNTNSTVKFWFIENFLSPSFLEFIPHMAREYKFDYELVTYKWPSWLRAQTEKQRIIWAYKILFLDVLFPMDLKKVIFVDADQIVRADLQELVDLDLHGAPYGYTPMGDDNYDMEGFRFWKTGYWAEFLRGKPYHISALYVVDLVRFRQTAAGDMLRGQYQQLSADPNSLANLDQDLPNNLQHQVPIFSLPDDWLWCETWCSKDRLHRAKTIDLCQNPLTKEPKLARARQIPEWEQYDSEIAQFARRLTEQGLIRSRISSADSNVLADQAAAGPSSGSDESEVTNMDDEATKDSSTTHDEL